MVKSSTLDPHEYLVADLQKEPDYQNRLEGGVKTIVQDGVSGYKYSVVVLRNGAITTKLDFVNGDNFYFFMIVGPGGFFETEDIDMVINSIKFFDQHPIAFIPYVWMVKLK